MKNPGDYSKILRVGMNLTSMLRFEFDNYGQREEYEAGHSAHTDGRQNNLHKVFDDVITYIRIAQSRYFLVELVSILK